VSCPTFVVPASVLRHRFASLDRATRAEAAPLAPLQRGISVGRHDARSTPLPAGNDLGTPGWRMTAAASAAGR
jgi:hypothetical protein